MQLTDEQLEQAARELCKIRRLNPDAKVSVTTNSFGDALMFTHGWENYLGEIKRWLQIQEAVNRVVGKQDPDQFLADLKGAGEAISRTAEGLKPV